MTATLACLMLTLPAMQQTNDEGLIAKMVAALSDNDLDVRQNLAVALVRVGLTSVPPLTAALKDGNSDRRAGAAYALSLHGESARAAVPVLLELLDDPNLEVRRQASYALSRVVSSRSQR